MVTKSQSSVKNSPQQNYLDKTQSQDFMKNEAVFDWFLTKAISSNRPGHRATDVIDCGPTFKERFQHYSSIQITCYLEFHSGQLKIVSRDKLLSGN